MSRFLAIVRLLVFLALFGLTPVWATEDGCCCGTSEPVCNMTIESRSPLTISEVRELLGLHPVVRSAPALCAASDTADEEQKILLQVAQLQSELAQRQRDAGNIPELVLAQYQAMLLQARTQFYDRQMALFEARQETRPSDG